MKIQYNTIPFTLPSFLTYCFPSSLLLSVLSPFLFSFFLPSGQPTFHPFLLTCLVVFPFFFSFFIFPSFLFFLSFIFFLSFLFCPSFARLYIPDQRHDRETVLRSASYRLKWMADVEWVTWSASVANGHEANSAVVRRFEEALNCFAFAGEFTRSSFGDDSPLNSAARDVTKCFRLMPPALINQSINQLNKLDIAARSDIYAYSEALLAHPRLKKTAFREVWTVECRWRVTMCYTQLRRKLQFQRWSMLMHCRSAMNRNHQVTTDRSGTGTISRDRSGTGTV